MGQLAADHGFAVLSGARDPDAAGEPDHTSIDWVPLDVTNQAGVDELAAQVRSEPGRLDVLVNNAGIYGGYESVGEYNLQQAHAVLETNVFGAWRLTQAMLPLLHESPRARIVNVSSGGGQLSDMDGGRAAYQVSKAGLNVLTRVLAADEEGILTNSLCPGWVRTDMGGQSAPRPVEEGADTAVWLATIPGDGPSGGFFRNREPIPW